MKYVSSLLAALGEEVRQQERHLVLGQRVLQRPGQLLPHARVRRDMDRPGHELVPRVRERPAFRAHRTEQRADTRNSSVRDTCQPPRLPAVADRHEWQEKVERVPAPATTSATSASTPASMPDSAAANSKANPAYSPARTSSIRLEGDRRAGMARGQVLGPVPPAAHEVPVVGLRLDQVVRDGQVDRRLAARLRGHVTLTGSDGFTSQTSQTPSSSIKTLLDQYNQFYGELLFQGVPDGIITSLFLRIDGSFENQSEIVNLNTLNGTVSQTCVNAQDNYFSPNDNTSLFTGVEVTNGTMNITMSQGSVGTERDFCGIQLQLVSYATSVTNTSLTFVVTNVITGNMTNNALTLSWIEGTLQTATNVTGPWLTLSDPSPITVVTTNARQFFRLKIPASVTG